MASAAKRAILFPSIIFGVVIIVSSPVWGSAVVLKLLNIVNTPGWIGMPIVIFTAILLLGLVLQLLMYTLEKSGV